jgi:DNA processing protein
MILSEAELLKMLGAMPPLDLSQQSSLFSNSIAGDIPTSEIASAPLRQRATRLNNPAPLNNPPPPPAAPTINLEPNLKQVFQVIPPEAIAFDLIVEQAGMNAGEVSSALLQLELLGLVSQLPGMRYQRN